MLPPSSSSSRAAPSGSSTTRRSTSPSSTTSSALAGLPACAGVYAKLTDTLALARDMFPGKRNNLDALCERFGVDNRHRTLHGALLDAELLAEVWLAMTRGQETLTIDIGAAFQPLDGAAMHAVVALGGARAEPLVVLQPSPDELVAHAAYLEALDRDSRAAVSGSR